MIHPVERFVEVTAGRGHSPLARHTYNYKKKLCSANKAKTFRLIITATTSAATTAAAIKLGHSFLTVYVAVRFLIVARVDVATSVLFRMCEVWRQYYGVHSTVQGTRGLNALVRQLVSDEIEIEHWSVH